MVYKPFCDKCGKELKKEHHTITIGLDENWKYFFDVCDEHYEEFANRNLDYINRWKMTIIEDTIRNELLEQILTCHSCGKPFKRLDEHTYAPNCKCIKQKIRISVG